MIKRFAASALAFAVLTLGAMIPGMQAPLNAQEVSSHVVCPDPQGKRAFCMAREYEVLATGVDAEDAKLVAAALDIPTPIGRNDGTLQHVELGGLYRFVPTITVRPTEQPQDEHRRPTSITAFDLEALKKIKVLGDDEAVRRARGAFGRAGLLPPGATPHVSHAKLELKSPRGEPIASAALDTTVAFNSSLMGVPLRGPGAKIMVTFNGDGKVTHLRHAYRTLREGAMMRIMTPTQASEQCAIRYALGGGTRANDTSIDINAELFYYAPPLSFGRARRIVPHYACNGSVVRGGERIDLLKLFLPAAQDAPAIDLKVEAETRSEAPSLVRAHADVRFGRPPYMFSWASAHTRLDSRARVAGADIAYEALGRNRSLPERVLVTVTDADGLIASAAKDINVVFFPPGDTEPTEYPSIGVEWIDGGLAETYDNAHEFYDTFQPTAVVEVERKFIQGTFEGREIDFKDIHRDPDGRDHNWIDDVDLAFYVGHGNPNGWVMSTAEEDTFVHYNDTQFGDKDLEWMVLYACKVLQPTASDGKTLEERWGPSFAGLHSLVGFATSAWDLPGIGPAFAERILGKNAPAMSIVDAWTLSASEVQWGVDIAAMGPVSMPQIVATAGGTIEVYNVSTYTDHFWNRGPVASDILPGFAGFWTLSVHVD